MKQNIKLFILLGFLISIYSCAYYNTFYNAKKYYKEAKSGFTKSAPQNKTQINSSTRQNFNTAIRKSKKVLQKWPESRWADDASLLIAMSNYYLGNYEIARENFENFIYKYSKSAKLAEARQWYGKTLWELDNKEGAIQEWQTAANQIRNENKAANLYMLMGKSFQEDSRIDSALSYYKRIVELGSTSQETEALFRIVNILLSRNNSTKAINYLNKLSNMTLLPSEEGELQVLRAKAYRQKQSYDRAEKLIEEKLDDRRVKEIWGELELQLGLIYRDKNNIDKAISQLQEVIEDYSGDPAAKANYYLGKLFISHRINFKKAKNHFSSVNAKNNNRINQQAKDNKNILSTCIDIQDQLEQLEDTIGIITGDSSISASDSVSSDSSSSTADTMASSKSNLKSIDTLAIYDRYYNLQYELAENFYFDLGLKDTAKQIYSKLSSTYKFNPYVAKSLYALYYINKKENHPQRAEHYKNKLQKEYPNSSYLAYIKKGIVPENQNFKNARKLYHRAEDSLKTNLDSSIIIYKKILNEYDNTKFAPRSALSLGWIYENKLIKPKKAQKWYKYYKNNFPKGQDIKYVNQRLDFLKTIFQKIKNAKDSSSRDSSVSAPTDSSRQREQFKEDTLNSNQDSLPTERDTSKKETSSNTNKQSPQKSKEDTLKSDTTRVPR